MKSFLKPNLMKLLIFLLFFGVIYFIPYFNDCEKRLIIIEEPDKEEVVQEDLVEVKYEDILIKDVFSHLPHGGGYEKICEKRSLAYFIIYEPNCWCCSDLCVKKNIDYILVIVKVIFLSFLLFLYFVSCAIYHKVRKEDKRTKN